MSIFIYQLIWEVFIAMYEFQSEEIKYDTALDDAV